MPNFWFKIKAANLNWSFLSGGCVGSGEAVSLRHSRPGAAECDSSCSQTSVSEAGAAREGGIAPKHNEKGMAAFSGGTAGQI